MNFPKHLITCAVALFSSFQLMAQGQGEVYKPDTAWKVFAYNAEKTIGFSGGFNNPQFGIGDLNNDGKNDLVVYEKGSMQIKTFINYGDVTSPNYLYRPRYERSFPEKNGLRQVNSYMKIEDFNCDNVPDLLTRGLGGFSVWYGYYANNELHFNYIKDLYYSPLTPNTENFDPNPFPTNGWKTKNTGWSRQTSGTNPTTTPQQGAGMARFNSNGLPSGSTAMLISRRFRISPNLKSEAKVSFWIYRDQQASADSLSVYISPDTSLTAATYLNRVARCRNINQPDTKPANGWYQYTFPVPMNVVDDSLYLIFKGTSQGGNNIFLDNVYWISSPLFGDINAYVDPGGDIPGVADVDYDGDLDFFGFHINGGIIHFYKNYQQEEGLPCDTIHINLKDACWGKVYQGFTLQQTLGITCASSQPIVAPAKVTHTGNTLCMFDHDGDGDIDYLNGGVSYSNIQFLKNGRIEAGHVRDSVIAQDTTWQSTGHVYHISQFPAAFHVDIDQDGKKDILISPSAEYASENHKCIAYYRNTGAPGSPVFTYQHDSLLSSSTIDLGTGSYPMIYDYNQDGKPDLFVGGDGYFQSNSMLRARIAYYENTSTGGNLSFTLMDNDFLGIHGLDIKGAYPAAGDLDNDGLDDLLIGHADGTISFYKNMATGAGQQPQWQMTQQILKDVNNVAIDSADYAAPLVYDINKDGKKDLIIGGQPGWLAYYKSNGGANQLSLQYQTGMLGDVRADPWNPLSGFSVPFIGVMDNTGVEFLVVGSNSGRLSRYKGFQNGNVTTPYQLVDSVYSLLNQNLGKYSGFRAAPAIADLDGDGKYEMILGNVLGGVTIFKQTLIVSAVSEVNDNQHAVTVYPNPARDQVHVNWDRVFGRSGAVQVAVSSISGQRIVNQVFETEAGGGTLNIGSIAPGIYLCEVVSGSNRVVSKLVIIR